MNAEINALNISGTPVFWNNRCWNPLYSGTRCILKPRAFWNPLYSGTPIFWTFCILEHLYSETHVFWTICIVENVNSGNSVFWKPCIHEPLYSKPSVFLNHCFLDPCILEALYSGTPLFWKTCILEPPVLWIRLFCKPFFLNILYSGTHVYLNPLYSWTPRIFWNPKMKNGSVYPWIKFYNSAISILDPGGHFLFIYSSIL